jgi:copper chaperone CopZ
VINVKSALKRRRTVAGVKSASWSIETHQLDLIVNEEKTTITDVKKALAKAGHDTDEAKATDEDYKNLHHCCQYPRK